MSLTTPSALKSALHDALAALPAFETCALLDYPNYLNVGDHLIGLGTLLYLTQTRGARVSYVANPKNFSEADLAARVGEGPILLQGGGNFGDIWPVNQAFRERIVERYRDRPLILLPQTLHFREQAALERVGVGRHAERVAERAASSISSEPLKAQTSDAIPNRAVPMMSHNRRP